jgi:DNA-binding beta-propeller fold protein YncE
VRVETVFGGEGSGPGQFDDARYVAVDGEGNIFVADYQDGRIQKFDPDGKFLALINVEPDRNGNTIIRDMAGDYRGNLYVARGGDLLIYSMADGSLAGSIPGSFPDLNHDQVIADPANNLYAVSTANGSSVLKYSPGAEIVWVKDQILNGIAPKNKPSDVSELIVDGLGNFFILNRVGYEIYKFDNQGNFVDRFGSRGEELLQFKSPASIAVDGKGRLFLVDSAQGYVLKIFDNSGTFLKVLPWPDEITYPRMLLFDTNGDLYTVTNTNQVARMTISEELND